MTRGDPAGGPARGPGTDTTQEDLRAGAVQSRGISRKKPGLKKPKKPVAGYLLAKFGFDTAENEPCQVRQVEPRDAWFAPAASARSPGA